LLIPRNVPWVGGPWFQMTEALMAHIQYKLTDPILPCNQVTIIRRLPETIKFNVVSSGIVGKTEVGEQSIASLRNWWVGR
jgi:hypothetical protein